MRIVWLSLAVKDLREIRAYIAPESPLAATKIANKIQKAVTSLGEMPKLGRVGRVFGTRELVISQTSYIVVYRVSQNRVEILRILHGAREWPEQF
ncbi:MAG: type II toxin-antitoxin system RelE/ParE family toxin [Crocosphaera sp.]